MGCAAYADDLVLLAPSREAMSRMLMVCENYAKKNNLQFSTDPDPCKSKTKCLYMCGKAGDVQYPSPLKLNNEIIRFVKSALHLGHYLHQSCNMDYDITVKKAQFINRSVEIRDIFSFADPPQVLSAVRLYAGHMYGSMLWPLNSDMVGQFCRSWNTCVKLTHGCPRSTKTWLVENLLAPEFTPVKIEIMARYVNFYKSLNKSASSEVSFLSKVVCEDVRSTTAINLSFIGEEIGLNPYSAKSFQVRNKAKKTEIPEGQEWRITTIDFLLKERRSREANLLKTDQLTYVIDALCSV